MEVDGGSAAVRWPRVLDESRVLGWSCSLWRMGWGWSWAALSSVLLSVRSRSHRGGHLLFSSPRDGHVRDKQLLHAHETCRGQGWRRQFAPRSLDLPLRNETDRGWLLSWRQHNHFGLANTTTSAWSTQPLGLGQ